MGGSGTALARVDSGGLSGPQTFLPSCGPSSRSSSIQFSWNRDRVERSWSWASRLRALSWMHAGPRVSVRSQPCIMYAKKAGDRLLACEQHSA